MSVATLLAPSIDQSPVSPTDEQPCVELSTTAPDNAVPDDLVIYRLSVAQYHAIAMAGILADGDPVELLEGLLVQKMTKKPPHTVATQLIQEALRAILPVGWRVPSQDPITLVDSEPEPDLAVVRGGIRRYMEHHPGPEDLALVVEVADATIRRDRGSKKRIYARAGVLVYWIVNLVENQIEVYTDPTGPIQTPNYRQRQNYGPSDIIPVIIEGQEVGRLAVQELLP